MVTTRQAKKDELRGDHMGRKEKVRPFGLGVRIGIVFFIAFGILVFAAYAVAAKNVQDMLTDYTLQLLQSMVEQGVTTVEYELRVSQDQTVELAEAFSVSNPEGAGPIFPAALQSGILRMVYVTKQGGTASDGQPWDGCGRADIEKAFSGETGIYGPYFNEENKFVICYSAPVIREGKITGVLSIEKDGYYLSSLIKNIRFLKTGESYIIDAKGTDIAVSNQEHLDWVNNQYNARRLLEELEDSVTRSIMELEQKGLAGETGVGTYYWEDGLCYLFYAPVPSTGWVLLSGVREEELKSMTQSALYTSVTRSPIFGVCITVFLILTAVIIYWIVTSFKRTAEINGQLKRIANYDPLTGTLNRHSFDAELDILSGCEFHSFACIYVDANGLHEINNHLGHQAGDDMLKAVVEALQCNFTPDDVYRIGGDEFVVLCRNQKEQEVYRRTELARKELKTHGYEISIGIEWRDSNINIKTMVNLAEESMSLDKQKYYRENGKERQLRVLDQKLEKMVTEKQDADTFLSILAPEFKGVYFVDMGADTIRHLFIPSYFEDMLIEAGDIFSKALALYSKRAVVPEHRHAFEKFCNFESVEKQLKVNATPELIYQKTDGSWMKLRVLKFKTYTETCRETLWIFSNLEGTKEGKSGLFRKDGIKDEADCVLYMDMI